jgi:predicted nucleic acid-binding protein
LSFLADINILIDLCLDRRPWAEDAQTLFDRAAHHEIDVLVAAVTLPTLFYIVEKYSERTKAFKAIDHVLATAVIVPVDVAVLHSARGLPGDDFEDNIQIVCAMNGHAQFIVTRDCYDFRQSPIDVVDLSEALRRIPAKD